MNGINAGGKQITNVADGINAKDAVNKGQLDKQINEVKDQIGKDIGKLSDHAVQYDKDKMAMSTRTQSLLGGGEKGTNLKNVADGKVAEGSKDAVNGGQLWNVQNQVDKNSNDIKNIQNNIDNISNGKAGLVQQQNQMVKSRSVKILVVLALIWLVKRVIVLFKVLKMVRLKLVRTKL